MLVYTTQVDSTFRVRWLARSEVISQVLFTSEQPKKNSYSYSACVVYTKMIIHLSVGESGGYLPPPWWIITVNIIITLKFESCE